MGIIWGVGLWNYKTSFIPVMVWSDPYLTCSPNHCWSCALNVFTLSPSYDNLLCSSILWSIRLIYYIIEANQCKLFQGVYIITWQPTHGGILSNSYVSSTIRGLYDGMAWVTVAAISALLYCLIIQYNAIKQIWYSEISLVGTSSIFGINNPK